MNYLTLENVLSVRQDMLIVSIHSPSATKVHASTSFMFSSTSTLFGYKVDGIFGARTPLKPLAPQGEEEEPVLHLCMSGYFLVKNFKAFLKSHHSSSNQEKEKSTVNPEEFQRTMKRVERKTKHSND